jgi:hypothetical protein
MARLHAAAPLVGARLRREVWQPGMPPVIARSETTDVSPFDLANEPPLRVAVSDRKLIVVGHHAAFDGRALLSVSRVLLGGPLPIGADAPAPPPAPPPARPRLPRRADTVAPTGEGEVLLSRSARAGTGPFSARLADAAVAAVADHNQAHRRRWSRVGITIGVGGDNSIGNTASYRRCVVTVGERVEDAVVAELASPAEPPELSHAPRLLMLAARPLLSRFSDSLLVSNLGRIELPGASAVEFYPVARGRSAVSLGAASVDDGEPIVTLRALHLAPADAELLLQRIVERFH